MKTILNGAVINAEEVAEIIKKHGVSSVIEDGAFVECATEEVLEAISGLDFICDAYLVPKICFKDEESRISIVLGETAKVGFIGIEYALVV